MLLILSVFLITPSVLGQNETSGLIDSLCDDECVFLPKNLTAQNYKEWPKKCETVCATLSIAQSTDLTEAQLTATFKNLKKLVGSLVVMRTKYKSMKFLEGLESLECDDSFFMCLLNPKMKEIGLVNLKSISCRIYITSNVEMSRLNLPKLTSFSPSNSNETRVDMSLYSLAPDFCITIEEMTNFLNDADVDVGFLPGRYCDVMTSSNVTEKVCEFENSTLSDMESGCVHVRGDVIVESGDEEYVEKLETVKSIFGALVINGTNLTDVDFLSDLQLVASVKRNQPAIQVRFNAELSNITFPSLKRVRSDIRASIVFDSNSEHLLMEPSICFGIRNSLNLTDSFAPTIDGESCEHIQADAIRRSTLSSINFPLLSLSLSLISFISFTCF